MSILTLITGIRRTKQIRPSEITNPTNNLDDFAPAKMMLHKAEFNTFPTLSTNAIYKSEKVITPYGVPFGISCEALEQFIKKPVRIINNEENIPNHKIHLIKRKIGEISIASQFHFINNKLFFVVDKFNRHYAYLEQALMHTVNGYFSIIPLIRQDDVESKVLKDNENHYLCLDSHCLFTAKYFAPEIWQEGLTDF